MRHPTPPAPSERAQSPVQMADTASQSSEKEARAVPEDPDARKVFIQQVSGVHSIHHSWWHVLTIRPRKHRSSAIDYKPPCATSPTIRLTVGYLTWKHIAASVLASRSPLSLLLVCLSAKTPPRHSSALHALAWRPI